METTIPCYSKKENKAKYIFDIKQNIFCLMHPLILYYNLKDSCFKENIDFPLDTFTDLEKEYYRRKYQFLQSHGFFQQTNYQNDIGDFLDKNAIENLIKNLTQLVLEVTDKCNLKCKYCAYGEMYCDYDKRDEANMSFNMIQNIIDYLAPLLSESNDILYISFYGGEPLLNMDSIKKTIDYLKNIKLKRKIQYTMTTNGILLDKYIDILTDNNFKVLISIDGNKKNHSYRVFPSGDNSFDKVYANIKMIKENYPHFFDENIEFNTVLHNRNSIKEAHNFLYKEFGKATSVSPLDNAGINPQKIDQFKDMYYDINKELIQLENDKNIIDQQLAKNPIVYDVALFLKTRMKNTSSEFYEDILNKENTDRVPSGTCFPFQKKMFITVNGKILACERIDQKYTLGYVNNREVKIDYVEIAQKYNDYFNNVKNQCTHCYNYESCTQCLFQNDNFDQHYKCNGFLNKENFSNQLSNLISTIEKTPQIVGKVIKNVILK